MARRHPAGGVADPTALTGWAEAVAGALAARSERGPHSVVNGQSVSPHWRPLTPHWGHRFPPLVAIDFPTRGHRFSPAGRAWFQFRGLTPLPAVACASR